MAKMIPLTQGRHALVDNADYEWLSQWKWHFLMTYPVGQQGYATRATYNPKTQKQTRLYMHRIILDVKPEEQVDHINGNRLDNRRANLRPADHVTNLQNGKKGRPRHGVPKSSRFKGVVAKPPAKKGRKRWVATITVNRKTHFLGTFYDEREAALTYDRAAREFFGECARPNFPDGSK